MRPSVLALALAALALSGPAAGQAYHYADEHPPTDAILRRYMDPRSRGGMPPAQVSAVETYVTGKSPKTATSLELQARFVTQPPTDEELKPFLQSNPKVPANMNDAVWSYLYNKPMNQLSETELRIEIRTQEEAKAKQGGNPVYDDGLRRLHELLAAKETEHPSEAPKNQPPKKDAPVVNAPKTETRPPINAPGGAAPNSLPPRKGAGAPGEGAGSGGDDNASMADHVAAARSSGGGGGGGGGSAAGSGAAEQRGAAAAKAAGAMGEKLKSDRPDLPDLPPGAGQNAGRPGAGGPGGGGGAGGEGGGAGGIGGAGGAGGAGGTAGAAGGLDLTAAAASGFAASFTKAGLKFGTGASAGKLLRADGSPATPADVARLRQQIASDPQALMRRPDFFNVISRDNFDRLKSDFHAKPETHDAAFRHVGLTEKDRDFQRTETCNKNLESGCNKLAKEPYKKGELLSPEDLNDINEALSADEDEEIVSRSREIAAGDKGEAADSSDGEPGLLGSIAARLGFASAPTAGSAAASVSGSGYGGSADGIKPAGTRSYSGRARKRAAKAKRGGRPAGPLLRWWQVAVVAGLVGAWLFSGRRRRSFLERE